MTNQIFHNGAYREMTPEEVETMKSQAQLPPPPDPMSERMDKQEKKLDSIEGLCNSILSLLRGGKV